MCCVPGRTWPSLQLLYCNFELLPVIDCVVGVDVYFSLSFLFLFNSLLLFCCFSSSTNSIFGFLILTFTSQRPLCNLLVHVFLTITSSNHHLILTIFGKSTTVIEPRWRPLFTRCLLLFSCNFSSLKVLMIIEQQSISNQSVVKVALWRKQQQEAVICGLLWG